jgi:hypothetical protein
VHISSLTSFLGLALASLVATAPSSVVRRSAASVANNQDIIDQLIDAATAVDRQKVLSGDPSNFIFDFQNPLTNTSIVQGKGITSQPHIFEQFI